MNSSLVVDAHHHFWDPATADYPWMTDDLAAIRRPFAPADLRPLLHECRVDRTVLVQTRSSLEETCDFLQIAASTDFVAGVVGWVDLTDPDLPAILARLRGGPGGQYLVGVRHQVHDEPDPNWLTRPDVRRGLRIVGDTGLVYDLLVRTRELGAAFEVVRELPLMPFVIDHIAKPPISARQMDDWAEALSPFASCPNVACKLSGMVTEADWSHWTIDDLRPYAHRVLQWFGPERVLFGSDWPVCLLAASYPRVMDACRALISDLPWADQQLILGENAVRIYGLEGLYQ